ncbi:MAG: hypothetical protein IK025_07480 [Bacteroidales bacterium]|nr:hypothetical protein [Bacteroidales bacterium]
MEKSFISQLADAALHFLYRIVYFLFIMPFDLWRKAVSRLSKQRQEKSLDITKIETQWPFLSFIKRFTLDFFIDGLIFIVPLLMIIILIVGCMDDFLMGLFSFIGSYFVLPIGFSLMRDFLTLTILPFRKFLSWVSKPAQYVDIKHSGEIKQK